MNVDSIRKTESGVLEVKWEGSTNFQPIHEDVAVVLVSMILKGKGKFNEGMVESDHRHIVD